MAGKEETKGGGGLTFYSLSTGYPSRIFPNVSELGKQSFWERSAMAIY